MQYERLLVFVSVACLSCAATFWAIVSLLADGHLSRIIARRRAASRARMLFALRAAPLVVGLLAAVGVGLAFARHEPRDTTEEAGGILLLFVGWAAALLFVSAWRLIGTARQTARCRRLLDRCAERVRLPGFPQPVWRIGVSFPVAAVCGVLEPRLIVSARVLDECTPEELSAVLRHERAHLRRRDNLFRAALVSLPDPLSFLRHGETLARRWHEAVEEAADDDAAGDSADSRVALAAALVRVGRMATDTPPDWMPALALFDGDNLERRVRRLLCPAQARSRRAPGQPLVVALLAVLFAAAAVWTTTAPRPLHVAMEWAIRTLP